MTIAIEGVLYIPDAKFNLVSVDCITKSTHFGVLFGKTDRFLTDPNNPELSQVLGYNHVGCITLLVDVLYEIMVKQQTQLENRYQC